MTRRSAWILCALTLLLTACAARIPSKGAVTIPPGEPLTLGVVAGLSGSTADAGAAIVAGARLAVEQHGPVLGHPIELVERDDGCDPLETRDVVNELARQPRFVGLIGPSCSASCVAATNIIGENGQVMITPRCSDIAVTRQGYAGIFRTGWTDALEVVGAADYISDTMKIDKVFLINDGTVYGRGMRDIFKLVFGKNNLAGNVEALSGSEDYGPVIRSIAKSSAGLVYYAGFAEDAARFMQQIRAAGVTLPVMAPDAVKDQAGFIDAAGEAADGVLITEAVPDYGEKHPAFEEAYRARYGAAPGPWAAEAYDAVQVLLKGIKKAAVRQGDALRIDRIALRDAIYPIDIKGASGRIRFRLIGDRVEGVKVRINAVRQGRFEEVTSVKPKP